MSEVKPIPRKPFSGLSRERLSSSHPDLLRSAAYAEASYLLAYFGDDALSGLAVYFEAISEDFRARVRRRDQASKLAAAEKLEDLRVRYPHLHVQPRNQQARLEKESCRHEWKREYPSPDDDRRGEVCRLCGKGKP